MKDNLISVLLMFLVITMMPIFASSEEVRCTINVESAKTGTEDKTQLIIVRGHIDETIKDLLPATIIIDLNGVQIPAEIHENMTYTATFIAFGGYVAGVGDVVRISIDKDGINLFRTYAFA